MKKLLLIGCFGLLACYSGVAQTVIELDNQSMCIAGKGPGQDGAINPYLDSEHSYGIVENIGKNEFSVRIQTGEKILKQIPVKVNETKTIKLMKGEVMYFDSELKTAVKVDFKAKLE